jgi:hypothetical protein
VGLFAKPILRAPEQGEADKPAYRRVEYRTSGPSIAVLLQIPENPQPNHRLALLVALARGIWVVGIRVHQILKPSVQLAVFLPDKYDRLGLAGNVVNRLPPANGRIGGRVLCPDPP